MLSIRIISFGFGYGEPPPATVTLDVRKALHDPHIEPAMRQMTARDSAVLMHVAQTPGSAALLDSLAELADHLFRTTREIENPIVTIAIGCTGGRHRAPSLAMLLQPRLTDASRNVEVVHRDIDKPVINR